MAAINVVRFRVKPGREQEFVDAHRNLKLPGIRRAWLVKTGDRTYCIVGMWKELSDLVAARPAMIANLDKMRAALEDLGGGLGVTDPASGEVVVSLGGGGGKSGKGGKAGKAGKAGRGGGSAPATAVSAGVAAAGATAAGGKGKGSKAERKAARAARKAAKKAGKGKPK